MAIEVQKFDLISECWIVVGVSVLLEIRRGENPRSQNRPSKTRRGAAESGFAGPVLGPWIEPSLISY